MNIVIMQNNGAASASLTQYNSALSYLITDIKVCVHNKISNPVITFVSTQGFEYRCQLSENGTSMGTAFTAHLLEPEMAIPEDDYRIRISLEDKIIQISSIVHIKHSAAPAQTEGIFDEHNYLLVNGRTIKVVEDQVQLLAEDENSQEIRFKIRKRYDNVSFLTEDKVVSVDFIPSNWAAIKEEIRNEGIEGFDPEAEFVSDVITKIYEDPQNSDYMILCWTVPLIATREAGNLQIALSVMNDVADYVWQTSPATLTVQPNIGKRDKYVITSIESPIAKIESRIEALENLFGGSATVTLEEGEKA